MAETLPAWIGPVKACAEGRVAPNLALMQLLTQAPDEETARTALGEMSGRRCMDAAAVRRLAKMGSLWRALPELFSLLKTMARLTESGATSATDWAHVFDRAAAYNPDASVALYSLGDAPLLAQITEELVRRLMEWELVAPGSRILDLGCGTGRIANAVAHHAQAVLAIDCSETMVQIAHREAVAHRNVCVLRTSGEDLAFISDGTLDTVLVVDSFPYLVSAQTAERHLGEMARVLKPGGRVLIMNYSYRGDLTRDRAEISSLAQQLGFKILRDGTSDLTLWDGRAFLLQKH